MSSPPHLILIMRPGLIGGFSEQVYVFIGTIILEKGSVLRYIAGTIIGATGLGYCALEFMPQIEPPSNMRDADAGWGQEGV